MNFLADVTPVGTFTSGTQDVIGLVICDDISDLPAYNDFSGFELKMGSKAEIIADGSKYRMDSTGTWIRQPADASVALDLTGYYTSAEVDAAINTALASYTNTADMNTAINTSIMVTQYTNRGTEPADGTDILTLPVGRYFKSAYAQTLVNIPSSFTGQACVFDIRNTTTTTGTRMRIDFYSCAPGNEPRYWFAIKAGTPAEWKSWIEMIGTAL